MKHLPRYITIEKNIGETPLVALERARKEYHIQDTVPLAYAGRLDPMASGTLLILVGDECKNQARYHAFDKAYDVELLLGVSSDTGDVLGRIQFSENPPHPTKETYTRALKKIRGEIALPYPHFSSKTVHGKPLHTWTLEGRLNEIQIPIKHSRIYSITHTGTRTCTREEIARTVRTKIDTIPPVTDPRKALGEDFRREAVRADWDAFNDAGAETYDILSFHCIASSGTYMRSLVEQIGKALGTTGLAYSIHRTKIGTYLPLIGPLGLWKKHF